MLNDKYYRNTSHISSFLCCILNFPYQINDIFENQIVNQLQEFPYESVSI